ncbi:hypothetical protein KEJ15_08895, partial [Candidatus Bathyarchaeota archaeon]|nr:hypothetical protein [Candidatus Bathyarchaeota archaeon]
MQIKYTIGIAAIISMLLGSFAGFSFAYFMFQPQLDDTKAELSKIHSRIADLIHNISVLQTNYTDAQQQLAILNTLLSDLQKDHANLQLQHLNLEMNFSFLENYVHNLSLVSSSSYYVFKQNSTYYAQNGFDGTIEYYSENCTAVINYALSHASPGGEVLLKALASNTDAYYIDSTILPPNCTTLASENRMVTLCLKSNCSTDIIKLHNVHHVQIRNIRVCGNRWNHTDGNGIVISGEFGGSDHLIESVIIENCNETGLWIQYNQLNNALRNVQIFHSGVYNVRI